MRFNLPPIAVLLPLLAPVVVACSAAGPTPLGGHWQATLQSPGGPLPFGLEFEVAAGKLSAFLINGSERIAVPRVERTGDRLMLGIDHYDASISATLEEGPRLEGVWRRTSAGVNRESTLRFRAVPGRGPRFPLGARRGGDVAAAARLAGRWAVDFAKSDDPAVAVFEVAEDGAVEGTFLTTTGDYRFLAGSFQGDRLRLSCFDGAHAFLFDARLQQDGTLRGDFWSRDTWHESWTARPDPQASLPDAFEQTHWNTGARVDSLRFPDLDGEARSLSDPAFAGRARILMIFGSWCPNCNDATVDLVELHRRYRDRGLSVVGLAFEMTGDLERDARLVRRYAEYHGIEYPLLIAGLSDKDEASRAFPLIDRVRAFPTTIFLHADGRVRAIHSGYSGPATAEAHQRLRERFEELILELLAEGAAAAPPSQAMGS